MEDVEGSVGVCTTKKPPFEIDFDKVFENDDPPPQLVIEKTTDRPRERSESAETTDGGPERLTDKELDEKIQRVAGNVAKLSSKLPDKGAKLKASLKALEEERERRKQLIGPTTVPECKMTDHMKSLRPSGASSEARVGDRSGSPFANLFTQKLETDKDSHTRIYNVFDKEPQPLSQGDKRKRKQKAQSSYKERDKLGPSWKEMENPTSTSSGRRPLYNQSDLSEDYGRNKRKLLTSLQGSRSSNPVRNESVVLLDEEEPIVGEKTSDSEEEAMRDMTIYYPTRSDPECVEVQYKDLNCLKPGEYLTSTMMNFYIRFLQGTLSAADDASHDYYFFNTYFYKKLQEEAVALKNSDKEASFNKLRRWWRGVNLFQKTYIFLPVHDDLHWSLAIICIPDSEDESGPIILHLDSLGYHCSSMVFENIKRLLREEWSIQKEKTGPPDVPFSNQIWEHLPRKIEQKSITVPRQNNDSDCGVFVLYFMERFIKDAPQRLKMCDLVKFGRSWFKPEEASGLRRKIKKTLLDEFGKSKTMSEPPAVIILPYYNLTGESGEPSEP